LGPVILCYELYKDLYLSYENQKSAEKNTEKEVKNMRKNIICLSIVLLVVSSAGASPTFITNHSFESPVVTTYSAGVPTGWDDNGLGVGVISDTYYGSDSVPAQDGSQYAYLNNDGKLWQELTDTVQKGTYTLTIYVSEYGPLADASVYMALYYGGVKTDVLASVTDTDIPYDSWNMITTSVTISQGDPRIGESLGIYLTNSLAPGTSVAQMWIDNVQLDHAIIPAPGALSLLVIGLGTMWIRRKKGSI
jgi:hypothetical protein